MDRHANHDSGPMACPHALEEVDLFGPGAAEHWYEAYAIPYQEAPVLRLPGQGLTPDRDAPRSHQIRRRRAGGARLGAVPADAFAAGRADPGGGQTRPRHARYRCDVAVDRGAAPHARAVARRNDFADVLVGIRLEYIDPVDGAGGGLGRTLDPPLPADAPADQRTAQERFPLAIAPWWSARA